MEIDRRRFIKIALFTAVVSFFFDPKRAGGSLVMDLMLRMGAEFRLITEETDSVLPTNPGFIYCMPSLESPGPLRQFPVIRFKPEEAYLISMGFKASGEDCIKSYERMWTYSVARDLNGILNGRSQSKTKGC